MNNIEPHYVDFNTAKSLKEKKFNVKVTNYWNGIGKYFDFKEPHNWNEVEQFVSIPEHHKVIDWFWETYLIDVSTIPVKEKGSKSIGFQYRVVNFSDPEIDEVLFEHQYNKSFHIFTTKQEAYSKAIDYVLEKLI
jgi:hypothetical protein